MAYLAFAWTQVSPTPNAEHTNHVTILDQPGLRNIEQTANVVKMGYANNFSNFKINKEYIDPDNSCEFCTKVTFIPIKGRQASVAYELNNANLTGLRRAVFFAMGQNGGEELYFFAVGKRADEKNKTEGSLFPGINFMNFQKVQLDNTWNRFEFNLDRDDLSNVSYPFGFAVPPTNSSGEQVVYVKGITFDDKPAREAASTNHFQ